MALSPGGMGDAIRRNLPAKTGRSFEEWVALLKAEGPATRKECVAWLKQVHGLGTVTAEQIAGEAAKPADYRELTSEEMLAAQYAGAKAALFPIYERLIGALTRLGPDVAVEPRQTYVSVRSVAQFAVIQASTRTRVDLGLRLPGEAATDRLLPAGSFGSGNVTHRVALCSPDDVDAEVEGWLGQAYEARAGRRGRA